MRSCTTTFLKLTWGTYLVLTSVYCLLAFLPYTYFALIKAPAYAWMPWFAHHHGLLYGLLLLAVTAAGWTANKKRSDFLLLGILAVGGIYLAVRPFMPTLQNNWAAYRWSLLGLLPLMTTAVWDLRRHWPAAEDEHNDISLLGYSSGVLVAIAVALLYAAGAAVHSHSENVPLNFGLGKLQLTGWSLISHVLVAIIAISILNLIRLATRHARRPTSLRLVLNGLAIALVIASVLDHFLASALSFEGWAAHLYAAFFALTVTLFLGYLVSPFLASAEVLVRRPKVTVRLLLVAFAVGLAVLAVAMPTLIGGGDWNGVLQSTFTIFFWIVLSLCVYGLRPHRKRDSVATILAVLLLAGFTYKALQMTEIFWARPLGSTDDDVARAMETYAAQDVSFQLAHHILGNARAAQCGDLCRILRQYTNIRDAEVKTEVMLVEELIPTTKERPNIFILVIDSMRPDYLGAYNPRVNFTPNLDAFARDSVPLRNVFTQYAGTTLSEPAIWSGAMLLHAHYMQPFAKVNSLEKLANTDGYQMVVSYDTVLSQILSPSDRLVKLDTDKPLWNQFEACSTLQQLASTLDAANKSRPVLFYAQPMNVHQFASNNMPGADDANWHPRPGFNDRIAHEVHQVDECLGNFFRYLKSRGLYDDSVIIVTSDHGDATGEFGRYSHSISIYPEVLRVPLVIHLPASMRNQLVYDDNRLSALTDITPSLYYLLGHRPIRSNPIFGRPLFAETMNELDRYRRTELFLASDERAVYGLLADNGRFLYTTYDYPAQSFLFDLSRDPNAEHNLLTKPLQEEYAQQIIEHLHTVAEFYGYKPGVGSLLVAAH